MAQINELVKTPSHIQTKNGGFPFCPLGDLDSYHSQTQGSSQGLSFFHSVLLFSSDYLSSSTRIDQNILSDLIVQSKFLDLF